MSRDSQSSQSLHQVPSSLFDSLRVYLGIGSLVTMDMLGQNSSGSDTLKGRAALPGANMSSFGRVLLGCLLSVLVARIFTFERLFSISVDATSCFHEVEVHSQRYPYNNRVLRTVINSTFRVYGHIHMAKTAGSTINGMLALNFERVCGNKGYSYDFDKLNKLKVDGTERRLDLISRHFPGDNRGSVPIHIMDEIGYANCDYISTERPWSFWEDLDAGNVEYELHLPCRDPIDHLLSSCNFGKNTFNCSANLQNEITKCDMTLGRFTDKALKKRRYEVQCFNASRFVDYVGYMSKLLQAKRTFSNKYVHRPFDNDRNKTSECLWEDEGLRDRVKAALIKRNPYYGFCDRCMGTDQELQLQSADSSLVPQVMAEWKAS